MKYRAEIDGLRAIAVIAVIFFHADLGLFQGGFVGVDIFFVISGYLITTIILSDLKENNFSFNHFYERRARRILPALFVVMIACIPFGWLYLLPKDMQIFSESIGFVALFISNVFFWQTTSYFDTATGLKPLIHTWSLSVEEQYYLLFPVFLVLVWRTRFKRYLSVLIFIIAVASIIFSEYCSIRHSAFNFYMLPTRSWELLIGALVAVKEIEHPKKYGGVLTAEIATFIGLSLIFFSIFYLTNQIPFPSIYGLFPTIGTALIIAFSKNTYVGRLLRFKPLVFVGLLSYSAYLWHQPIFAFAKYRSFDELTNPIITLLVLSTLLLAYLTWRFIEQPFRKTLASFKTVMFCAILGSIFFLFAGAVGYFTEGNYFSRSRYALFEDIEPGFGINRGLSNHCDSMFVDAKGCKTSDEPEIIVWGDSYAMHLIDGIIASKPDVKLVQATMSACGPFLDIAPFSMPDYGKSWGRKCLESNAKVREYLRTTKSIKYAVLSSPFTQFLNNGARIQKENGEIVNGEKYAIESFIKTLDYIKSLGIVPVIFSPTPSNGRNIGGCLMKARLYGYNKNQCNFYQDEFVEKNKSVVNFLKTISLETKVVWLPDLICKSKECNFSPNNLILYSDQGHLTKSGSIYLGQKFNFYYLIINSN